jgi:hypothetical protein
LLVQTFIDNIWYPLRDPKLHIREAAVMSLKVQALKDAIALAYGSMDHGA